MRKPSAKAKANAKRNSTRQAPSAKSSEPSQSAKRARKKNGPGVFTAEKRAEFLERYSQGGSVSAACKPVGVSRVTIFYTIRTDEDFAAQYRRALETNLDCTEDELSALAAAGNLTAIFGKLRAGRPEKFRDNMKITGDLQVTTNADQLSQSRQRAQERSLETKH